MAEPNGKRLTTFIVSILSAVGGATITLVAVGLWFGTVRANLDNHIDSPEIHMSRLQKESVARDVVDREIKPILAQMQLQLNRIESKVDGR
jgi:uncharacterized protein YqfA (UPF0365 family)